MKVRQQKRLHRAIDGFIKELIQVAADGNAGWPDQLRDELVGRIEAKGFVIVPVDEVATDYELDKRGT